MRLRPYQILIFVLIGSLLGAAVLGGPAKVALDAVAQHPSVAKHIEYDPSTQTYEIGRPFRHLAMGLALVMLALLARRLQVAALVRASLQRRPEWAAQLAAGLAIGVASFALMLGAAYWGGARRLRPNLDMAAILGSIALIVVRAGIVGLIEEVLFRGFVLQCFLKDMRTWAAVLVTSLVFASLHFLDVKVRAPIGFDPLAGFRALAIFKGLTADPTGMWPAFVGLTLVGIVLSYAYVWTGSLYLSIGLHAGWVFALQSSRLFLKREPAVAPWFFGDGLVVTGILGIVMLLAVLALVYALWGRALRREKSEAPC